MYGQEYVATTWAMANMNMIIHDIEGQIEIGDTFKNPKFRAGNKLRTFDRVVSNPMWNQDWFKDEDYDADELGPFPQGAGFPGAQSADWGWAQHIFASLNNIGRAAIVLDTGAASRDSGNTNKNKEKSVRQWFVEQDLIEGVIYLPENLFYNTSAPGSPVRSLTSRPFERSRFRLEPTRQPMGHCIGADHDKQRICSPADDRLPLFAGVYGFQTIPPLCRDNLSGIVFSLGLRRCRAYHEKRQFTKEIAAIVR